MYYFTMFFALSPCVRPLPHVVVNHWREYILYVVHCVPCVDMFQLVYFLTAGLNFVLIFLMYLIQFLH